MIPTNPQFRPSGPGLRSRIVAPPPPAPVPEPRTTRRTAPNAAEAEDRSHLRTAPPTAARQVPEREAGEEGRQASNSDVMRSTGSMAVATLISRITGFLRNVLIGASLGPAIGSAFNTANTLPNLITEIVLGAVLTSLVVPVLVRAEKEDPDRGEAFIRRLFTLALSLLVVVTVAAVVGAPLLTRLMLRSDGEVNVTQATSFAVLLLPQIFFYGLFALFMAVLNTKGKFKPGAWAPVANNIVAIAVLLAYQLVPGELSATAPSGVTDVHVVLLGLGTTLGVVVQLLIMLPALRQLGISLKPLWGIDARLKQFGGMAVAIIVYVAISQAGYAVTNNIASAVSEAGPIVYQNHWLLLQVPYGIIGVTLLTAIMPRLSRNAADGDDRAVVGDLTMATKLTMIALLPIVVFFTALGPEIASALFEYRAFSGEAADALGLTLSFSAFTLIPYSLVLLHLRVFYAREQAWTPTYIIAGITGTKVVLSVLAPMVASSPNNVVVLLGAANGFGFVAGAIIGAYLLRRKLGSLEGRDIMRTSLWAAASAIVGVAAAMLTGYVLRRLAGSLIDAAGSPGTLILLGIEGVIFLIVTGVVLSLSKLPEVHNLGVLLARLPGLRRVIRPDTTRQIEVGSPTVEEINTQYIASDTFASTPVPPPMSAGVVRGPRLVPGAPVSDGRFRLLADHGSVPGAQFWQAREQATGREVALVFVDTSGTAPMAPATPAAAAGAAAEVTRRTKKLAALGHPAIAENIEVRGYRSGCLVVADWVGGASLRSVADGAEAVNPRAAAYALSSLTEAAGQAHTAGLPLGIDNWARIRISPDGVARLAFPAVLPGASPADDMDAIAASLDLLIDEDLAPDDVLVAKRHVEAAATAGGPLTPGELAAELRAAGLGGQEPQLVVPPAEEATAAAEEAEVAEVAGFGSRGVTSRGSLLLASLVIIAMVAVGAAVTYVVGYLGGEDSRSPVSSQSLQGNETRRAPGSTMQIVQPLSAVGVWPADAALAGENPSRAVDGDPETGWQAASQSGLTVSLQNTVAIRHLLVSGEAGTSFEVYALPAGTDPDELASLAGLTPVASAQLGESSQTIDIADFGDAADVPVTNELLLWFAQSGRIDELDVIGQQPDAARAAQVSESATPEQP